MLCQDGSYLAEFLLEKGYEVHGIIRRSSSFNTHRIEHIYRDRHELGPVKLFLHYGDLTDSTNLVQIVSEVLPDEIYNLGAMSHVKVSFEMSEYTAEVRSPNHIPAHAIIRSMKRKSCLCVPSKTIVQPGTRPSVPGAPCCVCVCVCDWGLAGGWRGDVAPAERDPGVRAREEVPPLPGLHFRAVRQGPGDPADGEDPVLPALPLRRREAGLLRPIEYL